ncbi:MAG TPA: chloride channel protein [bacterium]|nr:chloride channel protein [bacterium]HOL47284.1 chloride channel protein [bacterium]HPQ18688.1 chloride channel protein [bacterium]
MKKVLKLENIFKKNFLNEEKLLPIIIIIIGLLSGFLTVIFKLTIHSFEDLIFFNKFFILPHNLHFLIYPILFSFLSGLLIFLFFPLSKGGGVIQLKRSLYYNYGKIEEKEIIGKFFTALLCIGSGLAVGPEGPILFMCAALGSWVGKLFYVKRMNIKNLVISGTAGGMAAAFNTPITGLMFALEELIGIFSSKILGITIISCVLAAFIQRLFLGANPIFDVQIFYFYQPLDFLFYIILGICAGFLSFLFIFFLKFLLTIFSFWKNKYSSLILPPFCGMIIGFSALFFSSDITGFNYKPKNISLEGEKYDVKNLSLILPKKFQNNQSKEKEIKNVGPATALYKQIEDIMTNKISSKLLLYIFIYKFLMILICNYAGISGGILAPTIFIGACIGGLNAAFFNHFFPHFSSLHGCYVIIGMGAFFAGIMKTPITSIFLVFEMTHNYEIILPLMISNFISYFISKYFFNGSIYDLLLKTQGYNINFKTIDLKSIEISQVMTSSVVVLNANLKIKDITEIINKYNYYSFPVIDDNNHYIGLIKKNIINKKIKEKKFDEKLSEALIDYYIPPLYEYYRLETALKFFNMYETSVLAVLNNKEEKRIIGIVTQKDVIKFLSNLCENNE